MVITFPLLEMEKEPPKRLRRLSDFPRAQGSWGLGREHGSLGPKPVLLGTNLTRLSELLFQVHESSQADSGCAAEEEEVDCSASSEASEQGKEPPRAENREEVG